MGKKKNLKVLFLDFAAASWSTRRAYFGAFGFVTFLSLLSLEIESGSYTQSKRSFGFLRSPLGCANNVCVSSWSAPMCEFVSIQLESDAA